MYASVVVCDWVSVHFSCGTQTCSCDLNSVMGDSDLCLLWTRYTGDSKIDPWDNPEIRISSCSEDQTAIRFQNRIISCECLFIGLFQFQCHILLFHAIYTLFCIILFMTMHTSLISLLV